MRTVDIVYLSAGITFLLNSFLDFSRVYSLSLGLVMIGWSTVFYVVDLIDKRCKSKQGRKTK